MTDQGTMWDSRLWHLSRAARTWVFCLRTMALQAGGVVPLEAAADLAQVLSTSPTKMMAQALRKLGGDSPLVELDGQVVRFAIGDAAPSSRSASRLAADVQAEYRSAATRRVKSNLTPAQRQERARKAAATRWQAKAAAAGQLELQGVDLGDDAAAPAPAAMLPAAMLTRATSMSMQEHSIAGNDASRPARSIAGASQEHPLASGASTSIGSIPAAPRARSFSGDPDPDPLQKDPTTKDLTRSTRADAPPSPVVVGVSLRLESTGGDVPTAPLPSPAPSLASAPGVVGARDFGKRYSMPDDLQLLPRQVGALTLNLGYTEARIAELIEDFKVRHEAWPPVTLPEWNRHLYAYVRSCGATRRRGVEPEVVAAAEPPKRYETLAEAYARNQAEHLERERRQMEQVERRRAIRKQEEALRQQQAAAV